MRSLKIFKRLLSLCISVLFLISAIITGSAVCLNGDIDNDNSFSVADARLALYFTANILTPSEEEQYAADVNRDGYITTEDAVIILRIASGIQKPSPHEYSDWEIVEDPTCTEDGYAVSYCNICDKPFRKKLYAKGHNFIIPGCTEDGYCSDCGETKPATGHNFVNGTCSVCNFSTKSPAITYKGKTISFNSTSEKVISALGKAQDTLTDTTTLGPVKILIYYTDYKDLGVFTFFNNKLSQFYTNASKADVSHKNKEYSLKQSAVSSTKLNIGDIAVEAFVDKVDGGVYSFLATVGEQYQYYTTDDFTANERLILHLVNGCRALHNASPLLYSEKAHNSAYKHSLDMATNNYFSHYGLNNSTPGDRMRAANINWWMCAENIAAGYLDAYVQNDGWYNSPGHRANMLTPELEYLGVGIAFNGFSTYRFYATQNFYSD